MGQASVEPTPPAPSGEPAPYRIMIVDDSAVIRGVLTRLLTTDPRIHVVASVSDGQMAVTTLARREVDVIILDIEMPVMDGLTALPKLIATRPGVKIIVASTLTRRNAEISLRCMANGADDYIPKPSTAREIDGEGGFKAELLEKVTALGAAARGEAVELPARQARTAPKRIAPAPVGPIQLRTEPVRQPKAVAIGSSTGGPQALFTFMKAIAPATRVPVFITQHMPPTFTTILAEHIGKASGLPSAEARDGERVEGGRVYVAPGGVHLTVQAGPGGPVIALSEEPPENYCRPSVDPMLRSLAAVYRHDLLAVILTGMGHDGTRGGEAVVAAGGTVIAQDKETSVVWGMPGAAAAAGICSALLPLGAMGGWVSRALSGQGR